MSRFSNRGRWVFLLAFVGVTAIITASIAFRPRDTTAAGSTIVPLELALLVDTSGSVDEQGYQLQQRGYVEAFRDEGITRQIEDLGGIAVIYIEWDAVDNQTVRLPWTHLRTRDDCIDFANAVQGLERQTSGTTMLAPALAFARTQFQTNEFMGMRRVIDVSGDGLCKNWLFYEHGIEDAGDDDPAHYGPPWAGVIASLAGSVDAVNGVFIGSEGEHLDFYEDVLPFGNDAFALHADDFAWFAETLTTKVLREISTPIPGTYD